MGTVVDRVDLADASWRSRHSALRLAVGAARSCLQAAGRQPREVDLLVNAGIYRDRNLGEPALAALIQQDIGANPEDPHSHGHGTFSFDVSNGSCGVLTALQIVDGFLKSHVIDCALIVAGDANPGHGMSEHFLFSPSAAALLCSWTDDDRGIDRIHWRSAPDDEAFNATVGLVDRRNILRFGESAAADKQMAAVAADTAADCLREAMLTPDDVDVIVAAPAHAGYRAALAERLGVGADRIVVAEDEHTHTAALAAAFDRMTRLTATGQRALLVAAGAGIVAGAGLYRC